MNGYLTTHVLDMTRGQPAENVKVELYKLNTDGTRRLLNTVSTNSDGRVDAPILNGKQMKQGEYELVFYIADYFRENGDSASNPPFLNQVPVRFGVADEDVHYHVPLLVAPGGYSTYRGS